jgi:hypothetical protein
MLEHQKLVQSAESENEGISFFGKKLGLGGNLSKKYLVKQKFTLTSGKHIENWS